jgi:hypothetical protein
MTLTEVLKEQCSACGCTERHQTKKRGREKRIASVGINIQNAHTTRLDPQVTNRIFRLPQSNNLVRHYRPSVVALFAQSALRVTTIRQSDAHRRTRAAFTRHSPGLPRVLLPWLLGLGRQRKALSSSGTTNAPLVRATAHASRHRPVGPNLLWSKSKHQRGSREQSARRCVYYSKAKVSDYSIVFVCFDSYSINSPKPPD